jgi:hypothetical protein
MRGLDEPPGQQFKDELTSASHHAATGGIAVLTPLERSALHLGPEAEQQAADAKRQPR